jgi:pimeloyl-ACP methyl ester carboxylesterase
LRRRRPKAHSRAKVLTCPRWRSEYDYVVLQATRDARVRRALSADDLDLQAELPSIGVPTLTVQGGLDSGRTTEDHAVMASLISRAELHVIDRGGSTLMLEDTVVAHRVFSELSCRGRCLICKLHRR